LKDEDFSAEEEKGFEPPERFDIAVLEQSGGG